MPGNPEAVFDVSLLPTGEVLDVKLRRSSGVRAYDDAVERAIRKSTPLPRPERAELFSARLDVAVSAAGLAPAESFATGVRVAALADSGRTILSAD